MAIVPDSSGSTPTITGTASAVIDITTASVGAWCYVWGALGVNTGAVSATGWTSLLDADSGTFTHFCLLRRQKQAGDTTFTFSWPTTVKTTFGWVSYTGLDPVTPDEGAALASNDTISRTAVSTPSGTPTAADRWAVAFYGQRDSTSGNKNIVWTPDAALTERLDVNNSAAVSAPWTGIEISDSGGPVAQSAQSYTATSGPAAQSHDGSAIIFLIPAASGSGSWAPSQTRRSRPVTPRQRPRLSPPAADQQQAPPAQPHRPRMVLARLRGRTVTPIPLQAAVAPQYPPRSIRRQVRGLLARRGHASTPAPAQTAVVAPPRVPPPVHRLRQVLGRIRGRTATPVPPQVQPLASPLVPPPVHRARAAVARARGHQSSPPIAQPTIPAPVARPRRPLPVLRRRRSAPVPAQIVIVPPPRAPQPLHRRLLAFVTRRGHVSAPHLVGVAPPACVPVTRPNSGTTLYDRTATSRPGTGTTARPGTGSTQRPDTGITDQPC